jgi:hypothetical protein
MVAAELSTGLLGSKFSLAEGLFQNLNPLCIVKYSYLCNKNMKLKEKVKNKVDRLDQHDLRVVEILIDSLTGSRKTQQSKRAGQIVAYDEVIALLGGKGLTLSDINAGREDRL